MSDGFAYLDILFFAMVAAFIALRLRGVLGRRTGQERRRPSPIGESSAAQRADKAGAVPEGPPPTLDAQRQAGIADVTDPAIKKGLTEIRLADPTFDLKSFLGGAQAAFAMVVEAFAKGDKDALRPLLAPAVYTGFAAAIDQRSAAGQSKETDLVAIRAADIAAASLDGRRARVTVRFKSEQVNLLKDDKGRVIEGVPGQPEDVIDLWTFERDTRTSDPNWELTETRAPE
jgi:predicted lipid-binding transport protein (Tim44 family)